MGRNYGQTRKCKQDYAVDYLGKKTTERKIIPSQSTKRFVPADTYHTGLVSSILVSKCIQGEDFERGKCQRHKYL